jgi:hypothetical protein
LKKLSTAAAQEPIMFKSRKRQKEVTEKESKRDKERQRERERGRKKQNKELTSKDLPVSA